jgi:hypothetical protein
MVKGVYYDDIYGNPFDENGNPYKDYPFKFLKKE